MTTTYHNMSTRYEWETPQELFDDLNAEFDFTIDVCASADNAKCEYYWDAEMNALNRDWSNHVCWMNPPYGREISIWIKKAYEESMRGAVVVCLVPARTDTGWWHDYCLKGKVRFIRGRVNFGGYDRKRSRSPFPSAIVVFAQKVLDLC